MSYEYLLGEGYIQTTTGSGTYVSQHLPDELLRAKPAGDRDKPRSSPGRKPNYKKFSRYGSALKEKPWLNYGGEEPEIQFSLGRPAVDQFPMRQWLHLVNRHYKKAQLWHLDCPSQSQGYLPLRKAIGNYLARARAVRCDPDQILIVNGSQQGVDLVTSVLVDRGDPVGVENPGYIGARKAFEMQGADLRSIPVDGSGLTLDFLKLPESAQLKLIYITPSHQFPTGVVMSLPRRLELLRWAELTGTFLVEDDYDSEYRYAGRPVPALAALEHHETVIYMGTFSKVLFPALRLGYLVLPQPLVEVFKKAKWLADRHSPLLDQQVLTDFINEGHLERHVRRMRALYQHRRQTVIDALHENFAERVTTFGENAGINILIRLKSELSDEEIVRGARQAGVGIVSTHAFYSGESPRGEFLLNYGGLKEADITTGITRLAAVVKSA